jgi:hypothetical protein
LSWKEEPEDSAEKGSLEIKADTLVTIGDSTGDQFDFEILNFTPINCGHAANKPYLLRASSRDERDMWVSAPVVT